MGKKKWLTEDAKWGYLLVAPTIIGLVLLNVYPFIQTLVLSFSTTHPFGYYEITGVGNYVQMFSDKEFWKATWNSIYFCILTVPLGVFLSLLTAVLLNAKIAGKTAFRAVSYTHLDVYKRQYLTGFYEDTFGGERLLDQYCSSFIATRAVKPAKQR